MEHYTSLTPIKRFINLLQVDKQEIISIYVYALFSGIVTLSLPLGIQAIINLIGGGQVSTSWIILVIFVIAGVALTGAMQIMQLSISENIQQKIFTRSAFEFAYRIPRMKLEAVDRFHIPELVNRFFDTLSVQKGLSKILLDFSSATLQVVFGLILLSFYHPFFILFSFVLVTIVFLIFRFAAPLGMKTSLEESKRKYEVVYWLEEVARTMETFKLSGTSPLPLSKTDEVVEEYLISRKAHFKTLLIQYINLVGFKIIIAAGLLIIGGLLVINQQMNIGQFVASEIIIILVLSSVEKLILSMETIYDVLTSIEKIGSITDIPLESDSESKLTELEKGGISLHLNDLSYRFPDESKNVLDQIQMRIESGANLCLSGYNASGKSLLLHIIAGMYQDFSGNISYNGIPLGNWSIEKLRSSIGDSLSREDIFRASIAENISLNKAEVSFAQIQKASSIVGLTQDIESLQEGYNTLLLPGGKNLPSSIRLKIILARSIVGEPKLILLEDGFNQLESDNKNRLIDHLLKVDSTVIVVSNDPIIANKFDKVAVLNQGKLMAFDSFENMQNEKWFSKVFLKS